MFKKDRPILILAGLLVAQVILLAIIYWPRPTQATGGAVFPKLTAGDITQLSISDNAGKSIALAKQGDAWVLPDAGDFPAKPDAITALLDKLVALKTTRLIAETPASHARLQVAEDDFVRRLDLKSAAGDAYTIFLGSAPAAGATHFRLGGQDQVYQTNSLTSFDANVEPVNYIDANLVSIPAADVTTMTITNANGKLAFSKGAGGEWTLDGLAAGQTLDASLVQTLLNQATSISMVQPLGKSADPAWGMESPLAVVSLSTQPAEGEPKTYELRIGVKDEANSRYYVKFSDSPYFAAVSSFSLDDFVNKSISGFVATPTPSPTSTLTP